MTLSTPQVHPLSWFALLAVLVSFPGCDKAKLSLEERIQLSGTLPGIRASSHSELRAELRLIEQSHTLPEQLNPEAIPDHKNAAVALAQVFSDDEQVAKINAQVNGFLGVIGAGDAEYVAAESGALAAKWYQVTRQVVSASEAEECNFGIRYERGFFNDVRFLDQAAAACGLLLIDAAHEVDRNPPLAMQRFEQAWQWIDWLAAEGHLESQLKAAELRGGALAVAQRLANRPSATRNDLARLGQRIATSLANRPTVESTLQRERAVALVTYEAIRLGLVDLLFSSEEREELKEAGVLETLQQAKGDQIDADEAAYLKYARDLLATADQPFHARRTGLAESDRLLAATADGESYPWFANRLFAENLTLAQAELAREQSRLEAWVLALAAATQSPAPPFKVNPKSGTPYDVVPTAGEVHVELRDRRSVDPRVIVPRQ